MVAVLSAQFFGLNAFYCLYAVDQPLFVELFCVNKAKPKMHCNGLCMLSKIKKQKSQDSDKPILPEIAQLQLNFYLQQFDLKLNAPSFLEVEHHSHYQKFYDFNYLKKFFRPPILA